MKVRVWGTRGSFPASAVRHSRYGENTSCFSIENEEGMVVLDGGTGLVHLGLDVMKEEGNRPIYIFLGHAHLDHILGLFVCPLLYQKDREIHIYGETRRGQGIKEQLAEIMRPPFWPVGPESFTADISWHSIRPGGLYEPGKGVRVTAMRANHPDQGVLYCVDMEGKRVVYGLDCEMDDTVWEEMKNFCKKADLLIGDAAYAPDERIKYRGRGHSSGIECARMAKHAGVIWLMCSHYGWEKTDEQLDALEADVKEQFRGAVFAKEGEVWQL